MENQAKEMAKIAYHALNEKKAEDINQDVQLYDRQ